MALPAKITHLVPSFHYDIEYLLPKGAYQEICFENLLEVHRLLKEYPNYTFRVEQVFLLEEFFTEYPSLTDDFRRFAQEGRFEVVAGMYSMADINMPSGESILRQLVIGKHWCEGILGVTPRVLDMGDCTGHPAQMPQIAGHCGYDYYLFERAVDDVERQCEIRWRGIDGTEIPTYWLGVHGYSGWGYVSGGVNDQERLSELNQKLDRHCISDHRVLAHGGDFQYPYERGIEAVEKWNAANSTQIHYSTYERALSKVDFSQAPLETCDWNPDRQGCYSSRIRLKQENRECESLLRTAEAASALAQLMYGLPADAEGLLRAWKLTFLNQFHDVIWGTTCDQAYIEALQRTKRVRMICRNVIEDRLRAVIAGGDADQRRVVVFNPLPWERKYVVRLELTNPAAAATVVDSDERTTEAYLKDRNVIWPAVLPPCGFEVFTIREDRKPAAAAPSPISASRDSRSDWCFVKTDNGYGIEVSTPYYRVKFAPEGVIRSLKSKSSDIEFVDPARPMFNSLCYQTDRGDLWQYYEGPLHDGGPHGLAQDLVDDPYPAEPHRLTQNGKRLHQDAIDNSQGPQARFAVEELSAERLIVSIQGVISRKFPAFREFEAEGIRIEWDQRVVFRADDPQIDFHLDSRHVAGKWYRLRMAFFTDIKGGTIVHEIPFGRFERPEGEFAAQNYIVYYDKRKGLALLNRGLPGNNVTDGVLMLSLMRSVSIHSRVESDMALEQGQCHAFDYAIVPFAGEGELDAMNLARRGLELNCQPYLFDTACGFRQDRMRHPPKPNTDDRDPTSLFHVDNESVSCAAIYPHEDGLVLRLYETTGHPCQATITFGVDIAALSETDALLGRPNGLALRDNRASVTFRPFEIKTLLATVPRL